MIAGRAAPSSPAPTSGPRTSGVGRQVGRARHARPAATHRGLREAGGDGDPRHRARRRTRGGDGRPLPRRARASAARPAGSEPRHHPRRRRHAAPAAARRRRDGARRCACRAGRSRRPRRCAPASSTASSTATSWRGAVAFAREVRERRPASADARAARQAGAPASPDGHRSPPARELARKMRRHQTRRAPRSPRSKPRPRCRSTRGAAASASCSSSACAPIRRKALIHAFFAERAVGEGARRRQGHRRAAEISTVAIVGAGTMGSGIAMACANAGLHVVLDRRRAGRPRRGHRRRSARTTTAR